nr:ribosomal protein L34 [Erythrolobus coxiae]UNJ17799.1 ribosomal protein L34 [Erythrolobus coxiae]
MTKRTLRGTRRKQIKKSGFRSRMSTVGGRRVIRLRRRKKRSSLAISK